MEKNSTSTLVAAVALIDRDAKVLMQRRPFGAMHGGLWEFPGGKVDPGETPESAAVREIAEELTLTVSADDLRPIGFASHVSAAGGGALTILLFGCRLWRGSPVALSADELAWVAASELSALDMPPLDYPLAEQLGQMVFHNLL
ncbi:hypothetical protein B2G71_16570 [Novosphingobium sp. PC22D]|nr:(deoxy)nucleoside triphosphate pyrophosphohydrolase [Novosphingobium sp. PC22D]PEQ11447.1 hypothetical protein B2G71_16570 [Novosphingobium sp. PC22D]